MSASVGVRLLAGFVCAAVGSLVFAQTPAPTGRERDDAKLAQLAIEAARADAITPIPLDETAGASHGVIYDRFLLGVVAAKAALAAGRTPFVSGPQGAPSFVPMTMVVVANPRQCTGRVSPAAAVRMSTRIYRASTTPGEPPTSAMEPARVTLTGAAARALLPGVALPASALVVGFASSSLTDASVSIDYTEPLCPATLKTVDLTVRGVPARAVRAVMTAAMPADQANLASPTPVLMHVVVDREGNVKLPTLVQGPPALEVAAVEIIRQWRFEPARANGVPIVQVTQLPITFTTNGAPPPPPTVAGAGNLAASGPATMLSTADLPGLNAGSSRCAISDDPSYGVAAINPVKIGGDMRTGPARSARYFSALRGPSGEGLTVRRIGSTTAEQNVLDIYELSYSGLSSPARVYVDVYHYEALKAPAGFVCGLDVGLAAPGAPGGTLPPSTNPASTTANRTPGLMTSTDQPGLSPASSKCPVSDDDSYGLSTSNPIRIGGGNEALAHELQYMSVLRGPGGRGLRYRRTGAMLAADQKTIVDVFEVTYTGVAQPVRLYFDRARAETPKAPKDWACSEEIKK